MTITREQVKDLQPGDVVTAYDGIGEHKVAITGKLRQIANGAGLSLGGYVVRTTSEDPGLWCSDILLISRAPRPLYVNHSRTEPVKGDIVRDSDGDAWQYAGGWHSCFGGSSSTERITDLFRLTLLVDGETGEVVR